VSDTCGANRINANALSARQQRFLDAYRQQRLAIAPAARLSHVHRATVYRWQRDAVFAAALRAAQALFFQEHRAKVMAADAERQRWRDARERERHPMRCEHLARARAAKRR
jgi:hypothetical protein